MTVLVAILILWHQDHVSLRDQIASQTNRSSWSIRQVLGQPNTFAAGDYSTAWASQGRDSGTEWLIVEFPTRMIATKVQIEETHNPGAVNRVCSIDWKGKESELWKGIDPTPVGSGKGSSVITFNQPVSTRRLKIYLDSARVLGWNEIDAIALINQSDAKQWASDAWASSAYGDNQDLPEWFWP